MPDRSFEELVQVIEDLLAMSWRLLEELRAETRASQPVAPAADGPPVLPPLVFTPIDFSPDNFSPDNFSLQDVGATTETHEVPSPTPNTPCAFESQFETIEQRRHDLEHVDTRLQITHSDLYDKLVGPNPRPRTTLRPIPGSRRAYPTLCNRALIEMRQSRAIAHLDVSAMDEEIAFRILQHPEQWGPLGRFVENSVWGETMERIRAARMEARDDQREMVDIWSEGDAYGRLFPHAQPISDDAREQSENGISENLGNGFHGFNERWGDWLRDGLEPTW